jgi:hypothetical protein
MKTSGFSQKLNGANSSYDRMKKEFKRIKEAKV